MLSVNVLSLTVATATLSVNVTGYRYIAHLYCLAVQAGFYSDVVECSLSTRENLVRSPLGKKEFFFPNGDRTRFSRVLSEHSTTSL